MTLTAKGRRWLRRWETTKHVLVWGCILVFCAGSLAAFALTIAAYATSGTIHTP